MIIHRCISEFSCKGSIKFEMLYCPWVAGPSTTLRPAICLQASSSPNLPGHKKLYRSVSDATIELHKGISLS